MARPSARPSPIDARFAHGHESITLDITGHYFDPGYSKTSKSVIRTWDEIFALLGPFMLDEASQETLRDALADDVRPKPTYGAGDGDEDWDVAILTDNSWGTVQVQLRSLGLITLGTRPRRKVDAAYWKLTPAGDQYLAALSAIPSASTRAAATA